MASKRDVNLNITATEETGPATAAAGRNVDGLQRKVDGFNTKKPTAEVTRFTSAFTKSAKDGDSAMQTLQRAIDDSEARIAKIRKDFGASGGNGVQLFGDLKKEQADLRTLQNAFKSFSGDVEQAAEGGKGFEFDLVQAGIAVAPFLLPVAAGSVLGVLAFGGVGAGILGQLKDPAIRTAASGFAESVSASLTAATSAFGPEILKGLVVAENGIDAFIGDLKPAFDALAPEVTKIATDFTDGLAKAGPVLSGALIAAKPDLESLSRLIGSLPEDVADFASGLAIGAEGGATAIDSLTASVTSLSGALGTDLGAITAVYGQLHDGQDALVKAGQGTNDWSKALGFAETTLNNAINPITVLSNGADAIGKLFGQGASAADTFDGSVHDLSGTISSGLSPAAALTGAMNDLAVSISSASSQALGLAGDQLAVAQSSADFTKALHDNGKGFDENTQSGRDNESALLGALGAVQKNYQGQIDAGTATFDTTKKYDAQVDKLIDLAEKNGLAKDTAEDLRSQLEKVQGTYPVSVPVRVSASESAATAQLLARAVGHNVAFGSGDYLDSSFAFAPGGGGRGGAGGPTWTMPPAQVDVHNHLSSTPLVLNGRVLAESTWREQSHQRHASKVGAL